MRCPKAVIFALRALGEAREAPAHAQRPDLIPPRGQNLVRIGLVADVPDQTIARRVEQIVKRDRELDDPETCPEVSAGHSDRANCLSPQLVGDLPQLLLVKAAQIRRGIDGVEDRSGCCHDCNIIVFAHSDLDDALPVIWMTHYLDVAIAAGFRTPHGKTPSEKGAGTRPPASLSSTQCIAAWFIRFNG